MSEIPYRIVYAVLLLTLLAAVSAYRLRAEPAGGRIPEAAARRAEGPALYFTLRLGGLVLWLGALVYPFAPRVLAWAALPLPAWLRWTGAAGAAAAIPLVFWAQRSLGGNVTKTVLTKNRHSLVTDGPYRWVRHPLYALGTVILTGLGLLAASGFVLAALAVLALPLALRTRLEERALSHRFGDAYRRYAERTGRFLPRISRSIGG